MFIYTAYILYLYIYIYIYVCVHKYVCVYVYMYIYLYLSIDRSIDLSIFTLGGRATDAECLGECASLHNL